MKIKRRELLKSMAAVSAGFLGLNRFTEAADYQNEVYRYGDLKRDPADVFDLPEGFSYKIISRAGDLMSDGLRTPGAPDGMAAFAGPNGKVILIRNHELTPEVTFKGAFGVGNHLFSNVDAEKVYDLGKGKFPHLGGTTTLVYDPLSKKVERSFLSLAGTTRNCAGGPTPWNTWVTCEETVDKGTPTLKVGQGGFNWSEKDHGYNFEVPASSTGLVQPVPLKAMGRFNHEAIAVDPKSGAVYQTEDRDNGLLYRFLPTEPGNLSAGGKLQALVIRDKKSCDTRNWPETGEPKLRVGEYLDVEWIDMDDVESPKDDLRARGYTAGAARFARAEGIWYGNEEIYFACTNGGIAKKGQIFRYVPSGVEATEKEKNHPGRLQLYLEPNNTKLITHCDNVTVAPWGDLIICEDEAPVKYLRGVTKRGEIYTIGRNRYTTNIEICGACFSPGDPTTLFLNIQEPGLTLAITGPWKPA